MTHYLNTRALLIACALASAPIVGSSVWAAVPSDMLVVAAQIDDIVTVDPATSFVLSSFDVINNTYDKLLDFDTNDPDKGVQPKLAESWQISKDGATIMLKIRSNAVFHSGNPVRAEDAAWSLQRIVKLNKATASLLMQFGFTPENVDERITADGDTVTLRMDKPYAQSYILSSLTNTSSSVVDKELVMSHAQDDDYGSAWLSTHDGGSGAFVMADWRPNESFSLTAFDEYWNGTPAMKRVVVKHVGESATQRLLLERGDVDVARNLNTSDIEGISGHDNIKVMDQLRGRILYMGLNQKNDLLKNPAVIDAMKHLVDYEGISNSFLKGQYIPHQSFVPSGYLGALDDLPWTYDIEKARQILSDAGIDGGTVKIRLHNVFELVNIANVLQSAMAQVGLTLKIEQVTAGQLMSDYRLRKAPIYLGFWGPGFADPQSNAGIFAWNPDNSDEAHLTASIAWRNAYEVPEVMTVAIKAAERENDTDKRAQMYRDIQVEYQRTSPILPLFQKVEQTAMQENVQNWGTGGAASNVFYGKVTKE